MKLDAPLFLLLGLPVLAAWLVARRRSGAVEFPASTLAAAVAPGVRRRLHSVSRLLRPLALVLLVVAFAAPRVERGSYEETTHGVDVSLVLDVSSSMQQKDLGQGRTRLELAREVLARFIADRPLDRLGIISFALYPRVVSPLTLDHDAVKQSLANLKPVRTNSAEDNTAIGVALASAGIRLAESKAPSKVIVLLTDGDQRENAVEIGDAADYLAGKGIRLYTVAAASAPGPWTQRLDAVAAATGGKGFLARDAVALDRVYREIDSLEKSDATTRTVLLFSAAHGFMILAAAALLLLETLVRCLWLRSAP